MSFFNKIQHIVKPIVATSLAFSMLVLGACSSSTKNNTNTETQNTTQTASQTESVSASASPTDIQTQATVTDGEMRRVGIAQFVSHPSLDNCRIGFIEGLKEGGYIEGENLIIDLQDSQGDMSIGQSIAQKFATDNMDVVCAIATPIAQTCAQALDGTGIPLVFNGISDPVAAGLIQSYDIPDGQITGVSDQLPVRQELELVREILPDAKTIGILYSTSEANSLFNLEAFEKIAPEYGFTIKAMGLTSVSELSSALDTLLPQVDCIQNLTDNMVVNALDQVLIKADQSNIPVFGSEEEQVKNGCIASEGVDFIDLGRRAGLQAAKILDGVPVEQIPVEVYQDSKLTINLEVANRLNITLPETTLARASEVVN